MTYGFSPGGGPRGGAPGDTGWAGLLVSIFFLVIIGVAMFLGLR